MSIKHTHESPIHRTKRKTLIEPIYMFLISFLFIRQPSVSFSKFRDTKLCVRLRLKRARHYWNQLAESATIALRELETVNDVRLVSTSRPLGIDQRQQLSTIQQQRGALWAFRFRKWELVASYRQSKSEAINWLIAVSFSFSLLLIWWVSSPSSSPNLLLMFFVIYFGFRFSHLLLSFALNRIGTDWPTAGVHWIPNRITTWSALTRTKHTPSCDSGASSLPATTRISTSR